MSEDRRQFRSLRQDSRSNPHPRLRSISRYQGWHPLVPNTKGVLKARLSSASLLVSTKQADRETSKGVTNGDQRPHHLVIPLPLHNRQVDEAAVSAGHGSWPWSISSATSGRERTQVLQVSELYAVNNTCIVTYGLVTPNLMDFGLRRAFVWRFKVPDVFKTIIGVDYLHHPNLLVHAHNLHDRRQRFRVLHRPWSFITLTLG